MSWNILPRLKPLAWVALGLGLGYGLWSNDSGPAPRSAAGHEAAAPSATIWTCAMHPRIQLPAPGPCPLCGMDLIPLAAPDGDETGPPRISVSPRDRERMRLRTVPVERRFPEAEIRMSGKIAYDETRLAGITAWVPGRVDELYVDYTGVTVKKGDHMVLLFSPELYAAQAELLQAGQAASSSSPSDGSGPRASTRTTLEAVRKKLELLGLTPSQVREIEERGTPEEHVTIYAPTGGLVIEKPVQEGTYVSTGTRIFTIADLSRVWVELDAYESDLAWVRYGQPVTFVTEAYPGEEFAGTVSFIDPVLDPRTRTVKVRVIASNPDGRLKPEMFVRATVRARLGAHGKLLEPGLVGKWISPMHPEIIKDGPGTCDVCGMDLVQIESQGFVSESELESEKPLVIPTSAPLVTGKRAVVFVELPATGAPDEEPTYEGREIVLGPRAGEWYVVRSGLAEGELVVVEGNFKLDSALQIQARPSMMSPAEHEPLQATPEFRAHLDSVSSAYAQLHAALADDDTRAAAVANSALRGALSATGGSAFPGAAREVWSLLQGAPTGESSIGPGSEDLASHRLLLEAVTAPLAEALRRFGGPAREDLHRVHCPMAFPDRGADWLQRGAEVRNPYLGRAMHSCGTVLEHLPEAGREEQGGE